MITYLKGDMFTSPAQVLVNTVNTVGVMGKGIALNFKEKYPEMFKAYQKACEEKKLNIGNLMIWRCSEKQILLFPTKRHWREPSKLEYIEAGLKKFTLIWDKAGINSIAFPRLGCGNGKLKWEDVKPLMERYLSKLPIEIYVYVGSYKESLAEHENQKDFANWIRTQPRYLVFSEIKEDIKKILNKCSNKFNLPSGETFELIWDEKEITFKSNTNKILSIKEEDFCEFWNYIKDVGVIRTKTINKKFQGYADFLVSVLKSLDYLNPVVISDDGIRFDIQSNGYQYKDIIFF